MTPRSAGTDSPGYHLTRIDDALAIEPDEYRGHATGFRRQDLLGYETGSHHTTMSVGHLAPDGRIDVAVHSYEKSIWVFDGELLIAMEGSQVALGAQDLAFVPIGAEHQIGAGASGARWLEMSAPVRRPGRGRRPDTFFLPGTLLGSAESSVDLRDPRNRRYSRFADHSMDLGRLAKGSDPSAPEVSASMATALLAYSGIGVRMLVDQRQGAQLHTMFMVQYQPTAVAHPHDHPLEEAYVMTEGEIEVVVDGDTHVLRPGDVLWAGSGCEHAFYNRTDGIVRWIETQSPQPPAQHSYRFSRDWEYLARAEGATSS